MTVLGVLLLGTSVLGWLQADVTSVAGTTKTTLTGVQLAPAGAAGALALIAASIALVFTTRLGSRIVCLIAALAAGVSLWALSTLLFATPRDLTETFTSLTSGTAEISAIHTLPTIWVGSLLALLAIAIALFSAAIAGHWTTTVSRYDIRTIPTDSPVSPDPRGQAIDDWDALGRGEDPTK
ncbi:hypothetical protein BSZ39_01895 [Bowdeniella nasicola]|uniref:Tryptophan-associated transmembrane protein (Trp_oprn_chp) n=1 Tax=Bowdeniella nasicola TaxID=208480 RepID=A0A1Q5Q4Z2_9ACTO|nr:hypothetical protein BSZ39_01895 [Bowdeniella nasicola]